MYGFQPPDPVCKFCEDWCSGTCEGAREASISKVSDERLLDLIRVAEGREEEGRKLGLHQIARDLRRDALSALLELKRLRATAK
jgi:hypothetical protein